MFQCRSLICRRYALRGAWKNNTADAENYNEQNCGRTKLLLHKIFLSMELRPLRDTRVELLIIDHYPIIKHFVRSSYVLHFK